MDVEIAVCTFGGEEWPALARERALPSVAKQGVPYRHVHAGSIDAARNEALHSGKSEWIIYVDADDELEAGYVEAMAAASGDIRACALRYVIDGKPQDTAAIPLVNGHKVVTPDLKGIMQGNWIAIGAAVRRATIIGAGGWKPWPMYEDWDLWMRCMLRGATVENVPGAIYRAYVRSGSRNRALPVHERLAVRRHIIAANTGAHS